VKLISDLGVFIKQANEYLLDFWWKYKKVLTFKAFIKSTRNELNDLLSCLKTPFQISQAKKFPILILINVRFTE